jgi:hypothetical protein
MSTFDHNGIQMTIAYVTPDTAKEWLSLNDGNRRLRQETVEKYARDMKTGNWYFKPVAICFDEAGKLGNGQHTLSAIVLSEKPQWLLVARNVGRKAIAFMDMGVKRTISDVSAFVGAEIQSQSAAIARIIHFGIRDRKQRTFDELFDAYKIHREAIDFVLENNPRRAGMNSSVFAVCARAAYSYDRQTIRRFLTVLVSGVVHDENESAAIRMRDFCRSSRITSTAPLKEETYFKANSALWHFVQKKPLSKLYAATSELFPVPEPRT